MIATPAASLFGVVSGVSGSVHVAASWGADPASGLTIRASLSWGFSCRGGVRPKLDALHNDSND